MHNIFFFQTRQIPDDTILFDQFKQQKIFFSYFQVDQNYYLFLYAQESIQLDTIYQSVQLIEELYYKQLKIRSLRGFFLYALEIIENGKDYEILETNLQPFFWDLRETHVFQDFVRTVKNIIRQNKKAALQEFLFGSQATEIQNDLKDKIESLENQVNSLQQKVIQLEAKLMTVKQNSKYALSELLKRSKAAQIGEQDNATLKPNISSYLQENDTKIHLNLQKELSLTEQQAEETKSKSLSDASKSDFKVLSDSQQYNLSSDQSKAQNQPNFITLGKISEEEKIQIIQRGFHLQAEGKISLKKYYESTDPNSLFQLKGYNIKYETIRRTKFYQSPKN